MEQKFLQYLLYITLVEIRERAYDQKDSRTFWLYNLLHNTPFSITSEEKAKEAYYEILEEVKTLEIEKWLQARQEEFQSRFPEYEPF